MFKYLAALSITTLVTSLGGCDHEAARMSEPRPVRATIVSSKPVADERLAVGEVKPRQESELGFRVSGKVVSRAAAAGDTIREGDVVARLDPQDYENKVRTAQADVMAAAAVLAEAQANEARQRKLLAKGVTTRVNYDAARKGLLSAEAALQSAKIALAMAKDQLAYTELKAEFDGVVTATGAEAGQVVNTGQMIVKLAPASQRDAVFAIAEATLQDHFFEQGAVVELSLLSNPAVTAKGTVREVAPLADPATRTFQVKVTIHDPPREMLFGAAVNGRVTAKPSPGIELPTGAIYDSAGQPAVWLYRPASHSVTLRPVTVAQYETDRVIVARGVATGDVVVTAGVNRLREGEKVKLAEEMSQ